MRIIRTVFQDRESSRGSVSAPQQFILVIDMEQEMGLLTNDIPDLANKMEAALPGVFPSETSPYIHNCGGGRTEHEEHPFREEISQGTNIPHLLEHVLLHLLSRRSYSCSAFCGQRSIDIQRGISTHYYLVLDCPSKIEALVATELGFHLVKSWIAGEDAVIDPIAVFAGIREMIGPMLDQEAA